MTAPDGVKSCPFIRGLAAVTDDVGEASCEVRVAISSNVLDSQPFWTFTMAYERRVRNCCDSSVILTPPESKLEVRERAELPS